METLLEKIKVFEIVADDIAKKFQRVYVKYYSEIGEIRKNYGEIIEKL